MTQYLSHHAWRNGSWKEHDSFPKGAVKYYREAHEAYRTFPLEIYEMSEDRKTITLIPEEEWPEV